jgi:hypothetical protein
MSIKRLYRIHSEDAWTIAIHISTNRRIGEHKRYYEYFEGTKEEAQKRERWLWEQKKLGQLQPSLPKKSGRGRLQYLTPHHKSDSAAVPKVQKVICAGRGYMVVWQTSGSLPDGRHHAKGKLRRYRPDLVRALDDRMTVPSESEKNYIVATLINELKRTTGNEWVIPEDVIDWGYN